MTQKVPEFMDSVFRMVDDTIKRLSKKKFKTDPIVAPSYSAVTSVVSSAYKRHGNIIEQAIIVALSQTSASGANLAFACPKQPIGWPTMKRMHLEQA